MSIEIDHCLSLSLRKRYAKPFNVTKALDRDENVSSLTLLKLKECKKRRRLVGAILLSGLKLDDLLVTQKTPKLQSVDSIMIRKKKKIETIDCFHNLLF